MFSKHVRLELNKYASSSKVPFLYIDLIPVFLSMHLTGISM